MQIVFQSGAVIVAAAFVVAAIEKIGSFSETAKMFDRFPLRFPRTVTGVSIAAEIVVVVLIAVAPATGSAIAMAMIVVYLLFNANLARKEPNAPCACYGSKLPMSVSSAMFADGALIAAGVLGTGARSWHGLWGHALAIGATIAVAIVLHEAAHAISLRHPQAA